MNEILVLFLPKEQVKDKLGDYDRVLTLTPRERYDLSLELQMLPENKRQDSNGIDRKAVIKNLTELEEFFINQKEITEKVKHYMIVFVNKNDI